MSDTRERLDRIEKKVDLLVEVVERIALALADRAAEMDPEDIVILTSLTPTQHVCLQLVCHGLSNAEIGGILGVETGTVKSLVRYVTRKVGVKSRTQAVSRMKSVIDAIEPGKYEMLSGGIPKDWAARVLAGDENRWSHLYGAESRSVT